MQSFENQLKCHPAFLLIEVEESHLDQCGRISILDSHKVEQQIYIYKNKESTEYEVRIHKLSPTDVYTSPIALGNTLKRYETNDKFASFFFENFYFACRFVALMAKIHPEAQIRPVLQKH